MLVQQVVEMHGGTVQAFSAGVDQGSEFVVRLPILADAPEASFSPSRLEPPATAARFRILVADDNPDSADTLTMLLQMEGHETRVAHDGVAAIEIAESFRPDIVLLDLGMPRLDGYGAAREIRKTAWGRGMKLFALSGWGQDDAKQKSNAAGFDAHLVKPLDLAALARLLNEPAGEAGG